MIEKMRQKCYNNPMHFKHTLTLSALSLLMSGVALAAGATPANVKNVQATIVNGTLSVTWNGPADAANIASYRVYYSHESILGNDGNYDDFEQTTGPVTSYTFKALPLTSPVIFIGILAVSKDGVESDGFEVEASVPVPVTAATSSQASPIIPPTNTVQPGTPAPTPLIIVSAEPATDTGILLTFNKPLLSVPSFSEANFQVTDTGGTILVITSIEQSDRLHVLLKTLKQRPDTTYLITVRIPVGAQDGSTTDPALQFAFHSPVTMTVPTTPVTPIIPETTPDNPSKQYGRNPAQIINLPAQVTPRNPVTTPQAPLTSSGLGLTGIIAAAGAVAGRKMMRRKK